MKREKESEALTRHCRGKTFGAFSLRLFLLFLNIYICFSFFVLKRTQTLLYQLKTTQMRSERACVCVRVCACVCGQENENTLAQVRSLLSKISLQPFLFLSNKTKKAMPPHTGTTSTRSPSNAFTCSNSFFFPFREEKRKEENKQLYILRPREENDRCAEVSWHEGKSVVRRSSCEQTTRSKTPTTVRGKKKTWKDSRFWQEEKEAQKVYS